MKTYTVKSPVNDGTRRYKIGERITLDESSAAILVAIGAIDLASGKAVTEPVTFTESATVAKPEPKPKTPAKK